MQKWYSKYFIETIVDLYQTSQSAAHLSKEYVCTKNMRRDVFIEIWISFFNHIIQTPITLRGLVIKETCKQIRYFQV